MTLSQFLRLLHTVGKVGRDVNAVKNGRIVQRAQNRLIGKAIGKATGGVWR